MLKDCSHHLTCYVSCVTCHVSHVMCHISCVTSHMSGVICHMSWVTCHISFFFVLVELVDGGLSTGRTLSSFITERRIFFINFDNIQADNCTDKIQIPPTKCFVNLNIFGEQQIIKKRNIKEEKKL